MNPTLNMAIDYIEHCISRARLLKKRGDDDLSKLLLAKARMLASSMDNDDEGLIFMRYHRYHSDSFGVEFEITHGDPELMFGGVV